MNGHFCFVPEGLRYVGFTEGNTPVFYYLCLPSKAEQPPANTRRLSSKSAGKATFFRGQAINRSATRAPGGNCELLCGEIVEIFYNFA